MLTITTLVFIIAVSIAQASRQPHDRRTGGMPAPGIQQRRASEEEQPGLLAVKQARPAAGPEEVTARSRQIRTPKWALVGRVASGSVSTYHGKTAAHWAWRFKKRTRQLQIARRALKQSLRFPVYGLSSDERALMCIHGFEGSWTDPNAPFYGGLQMDIDFQRTYGSWALAAFGTADKWPISVQLAVAIRAKVSGRGFYPWPNTARYCGLIP